MEAQQLKAFLAVARGHTYEEAAASIGRTQAGISIAIKALEKELKLPLFEKVGRRNRLTPAGQALLELAGPLAARWEELPQLLGESVTGEPGGTVRVGVGEAVALYVLPDLVRAFRKSWPAVGLVIRNQPQEETFRMLRGGELDFGIRSLETVPAGLAFEPLFESPRVLIAPRGHPLARRPITVAELSRHPFVVPRPGSSSRAILERLLASAGLPLPIAVEAGGWEVLKRYVHAGLGIGLVPELCLTAADLRSLAIRRNPHLFPPDRYGIVRREPSELSLAAREMLREVRKGV